MKFVDLRFSALSKADEEPGDEIIDKVVYDAINYGYKQVATLVDKQIKEIILDYADKIELPDDFYEVDKIICNGVKLSENDYYVSGATLFITNKDFKKETNKFNVLYICYPPTLILDDDLPITRESFDYLIVIYGAYSVLLYKKRYNMAEMLFSEYSAIVHGGDKNEV